MFVPHKVRIGWVHSLEGLWYRPIFPICGNIKSALWWAAHSRERYFQRLYRLETDSQHIRYRDIGYMSPGEIVIGVGTRTAALVKPLPPPPTLGNPPPPPTCAKPGPPMRAIWNEMASLGEWGFFVLRRKDAILHRAMYYFSAGAHSCTLNKLTHCCALKTHCILSH